MLFGIFTQYRYTIYITSRILHEKVLRNSFVQFILKLFPINLYLLGISTYKVDNHLNLTKMGHCSNKTVVF